MRPIPSALAPHRAPLKGQTNNTWIELLTFVASGLTHLILPFDNHFHVSDAFFSNAVIPFIDTVEIFAELVSDQFAPSFPNVEPWQRELLVDQDYRPEPAQQNFWIVGVLKVFFVKIAKFGGWFTRRAAPRPDPNPARDPAEIIRTEMRIAAKQIIRSLGRSTQDVERNLTRNLSDLTHVVNLEITAQIRTQEILDACHESIIQTSREIREIRQGSDLARNIQHIFEKFNSQIEVAFNTHTHDWREATAQLQTFLGEKLDSLRKVDDSDFQLAQHLPPVDDGLRREIDKLFNLSGKLLDKLNKLNSDTQLTFVDNNRQLVQISADLGELAKSLTALHVADLERANARDEWLQELWNNYHAGIADQIEVVGALKDEVSTGFSEINSFIVEAHRFLRADERGSFSIEQ